MNNGGYQILNLSGLDLETGVTLEQAKTKRAMLISGLQVQDITLPDFYFNGTTEDGVLFTQSNIYLSYYLSVNKTTGFVQVATTTEAEEEQEGE